MSQNWSKAHAWRSPTSVHEAASDLVRRHGHTRRMPGPGLARHVSRSRRCGDTPSHAHRWLCPRRVRADSRSRMRCSAGHASVSTWPGTRRAAYRSAMATTITSSNGPMTGRNSGIRSTGERTHSPARATATFAFLGTRGSLRRRRAVVVARRKDRCKVLRAARREPFRGHDHRSPRRDEQADSEHDDSQTRSPPRHIACSDRCVPRTPGVL